MAIDIGMRPGSGVRIAAAAAYLVGGAPLLLTVVAGHGPAAVVGGGLVTVNLWLRNLNMARHFPGLRLATWIHSGLSLALCAAVAASPVGGWLAGWWLGLPFLWAYGGAALVAVSLGAWQARGRWPRSVVSRVLNAVELVLLRDGILAVLVGGVFHGHPSLAPAAAGIAAAQLLPPLLGRFTASYLMTWQLDLRVMTTQEPAVRWALWECWAQDALLSPYRPDDSLLRAMVTRALDGVSGVPYQARHPLAQVTSDSQELIALVDEALVFLEGWLLFQEASPRKWPAIFGRVDSIKAYLGTAKAQLAMSRGQYEEAAAQLAASRELMRKAELPNMVAFGELFVAVDSDPELALRIANDESLSCHMRRTAMFAAACGASERDDLALAASLYERAAAMRPGRRDRAVVLAELRRDIGRWRPSWTFRQNFEQIRGVADYFAGLARRNLTGQPFLPDLGETNALLNGLELGRYAVEAGEYAAAEEVLTGVVAEAESRGQVFTLFNACYWLARAHDALGDPAAAHDNVSRAIESYDEHRSGLLDTDGDDLGALTLAHGYALTLVVDHPEIVERPGERVFELAEQARARGMLEKLGAVVPPPDGPDEIVAREQELAAGYADAMAKLAAADDDNRLAMLHMVRSWRSALHRSWDEMIEGGGRTAEYARLRSAKTLDYATARTLLSEMDGPRAVVFEYHMTHDADMVVVVIRADLPEPVVVRVTEEHARIYRAVRDVDWSGDLRDLSAVLRPFLAPVLDWSDPGDVVCFVPFASMHLIPLHAMAVDGVPLLDRNPVCYVPSLTVLQHCVAKRTGRRERALVMADSRAAQPLPHARIQSATIGTLFPGQRTWLGAEASMAVLRDHAGSADLLHLACHGEFWAEEPERSAILLAEPDRLTIPELAGLRLRADLVTFSACQSGMSEHGLGEELAGLAQAAMYAGTPSVLSTLWSVDEISAGVVMSGFYRRLLSGVDKVTALRDAQRETRAMTGAELIAYCEAAMPQVAEADRWLLRQDVADLRFRCRDFAGALAAYEELAALPDPPGGAERLRLAQLRCRRALRRPAPVDYGVRPFEHPYYWAPFVLMGDWR